MIRRIVQNGSNGREICWFPRERLTRSERHAIRVTVTRNLEEDSAGLLLNGAREISFRNRRMKRCEDFITNVYQRPTYFHGDRVRVRLKNVIGGADNARAHGRVVPDGRISDLLARILAVLLFFFPRTNILFFSSTTRPPRGSRRFFR